MTSLGTNDFLENYYVSPRRSSQYKIGEYADFLAGIAENFVKEIYNLGARKISLGGIPPMGCMPLERSMNAMSGSGCVDEYNRVAMEFNGKLQALVIKLRSQLTGIRLVYSDVYGTMLQAIENPSMYGKFFSSLFLRVCVKPFRILCKVIVIGFSVSVGSWPKSLASVIVIVSL